jgi:hypothetical protein
MHWSCKPEVVGCILTVVSVVKLIFQLAWCRFTQCSNILVISPVYDYHQH